MKKPWELAQEYKSVRAYRITGINGEEGVLAEGPFVKKFRSLEYNYNFDKTTGFFTRWGKTQEDDPICSPFGPEILDIEISTICHGISKDDLPVGDTTTTPVHVGPCLHCYKQLTPKGTNMTLDEFKELMEVVYSPFLTQIAFGIGSLSNETIYLRRKK